MAYGSPVRDVERLMNKAARVHKKVLNYPEMTSQDVHLGIQRPLEFHLVDPGKQA